MSHTDSAPPSVLNYDAPKQLGLVGVPSLLRLPADHRTERLHQLAASSTAPLGGIGPTNAGHLLQ
jgi:hypothetical protein